MEGDLASGERQYTISDAEECCEEMWMSAVKRCKAAEGDKSAEDLPKSVFFQTAWPDGQGRPH